MKRKLFFQQNQKLLLEIANSEAGKYLLGYGEKYSIIKVDPSGFHYFIDFQKNKRIYQSRFFSGDRVAAQLLPPLEKMRIMEEEYKRIKDEREAFLHFAGLETKRYKYPQIFLASGDYYDDTGEGRVYTNAKASWTLARDAAVADNALTGQLIPVSDTSFGCSRSMHPFNTAGLDDGASIIAPCTFKAYRDDDLTAFSNADTTDIDLVQSTQTDPTSLVVANFPQVGAVVTGSQSMAGTVDDTYYTITLDATGRGWISKVAHTKLAVRLARDTDNAQPTGLNAIAHQLRDGANPPYLTVSWAIAEAGGIHGYFNV